MWVLNTFDDFLRRESYERSNTKSGCSDKLPKQKWEKDRRLQAYLFKAKPEIGLRPIRNGGRFIGRNRLLGPLINQSSKEL